MGYSQVPFKRPALSPSSQTHARNAIPIRLYSIAMKINSLHIHYSINGAYVDALQMIWPGVWAARDATNRPNRNITRKKHISRN